MQAPYMHMRNASFSQLRRYVTIRTAIQQRIVHHLGRTHASPLHCHCSATRLRSKTLKAAMPFQSLRGWRTKTGLGSGNWCRPIIRKRYASTSIANLKARWHLHFKDSRGSCCHPKREPEIIDVHKKDPQTLPCGSKSLSRGRLKEQFNHF